MNTSKHAHDPILLTLVERIERRELDRNAAAQELGITVQSLNSRLRKGGFLERLKPSRNYDSPQAFRAPPGKQEDYEAATTLAMRIHSVKTAQARFPHLNYEILCAKVRKAGGGRAARVRPESGQSRGIAN